ncbi:unsaturated rhamnogalacturonyl hydrolase [Alteromonadaceae bacterium Bs31]|nr:unsaturated rhamnogalacturonyl hydrolase [Alteromonadaceae bacterium Bs31]
MKSLLCAALLIAVSFAVKANTPQADAKMWAKRIADSVMAEHPQAWRMRKSDGAYRWAYTQGLVLSGFLALNSLQSQPQYAAYVKAYLDHYINEKGEIGSYHADEFNIDAINSGKLLFYFYQTTKDPRYLQAAKQLREQLVWHPRTRSGVFWHKLKYPWQVWLDGLYMAAPFYAEYETRFNKGRGHADVVQQFTESYKQLYDEKTGLLLHGYDESRIQTWANPETGRSAEFWSRAMGWYAMALLDSYEQLSDKKERKRLAQIAKPLLMAISQYQDTKSGLWFQVTDKGGEKDNFIETSASAMFIYSIAKAVRLGILDEHYKQFAWRAFEGLKNNFLVFEEVSRTIELHQVCRSAGLGGEPYRDGSYDYYVRQTDIVSNDAHGIGALLLASVELARLN